MDDSQNISQEPNNPSSTDFSLYKVAGLIAFLLFTFWIHYVVKIEMAVSNSGQETSQSARGLVNQPVPDFEGKLLDGRTIRISDYRGKKILLLDFWASWCGPCRVALPELEKIAQDYKGKNVEVLAVNVRESQDKARSFLKEEDLSLTVLMDPKGSFSDQLGIVGIPTQVLVDKSGVIRWLQAGYQQGNRNLLILLDKILKEDS